MKFFSSFLSRVSACLKQISHRPSIKPNGKNSDRSSRIIPTSSLQPFYFAIGDGLFVPFPLPNQRLMELRIFAPKKLCITEKLPFRVRVHHNTSRAIQWRDIAIGKCVPGSENRIFPLLLSVPLRCGARGIKSISFDEISVIRNLFIIRCSDLNVSALSTVDRKINADGDDAIVLKIRPGWSRPRKVLFYYRSTARNIPIRITSSAIITSDGSQRRNEYFSETRAAATRDQFCSEKNSFPRRMRYIYRRVERINNAGTMRIAYARNEFLFQ